MSRGPFGLLVVVRYFSFFSARFGAVSRLHLRPVCFGLMRFLHRCPPLDRRVILSYHQRTLFSVLPKEQKIPSRISGCPVVFLRNALWRIWLSGRSFLELLPANAHNIMLFREEIRWTGQYVQKAKAFCISEGICNSFKYQGELLVLRDRHMSRVSPVNMPFMNVPRIARVSWDLISAESLWFSESV